MSDMWSKALESLLKQMQDHGYTGFPKVGAMYERQT
jgi:hypothetical protein